MSRSRTHGMPRVRFSWLPALGLSPRLLPCGWYVPWRNGAWMAGQCAVRQSGRSSTRMSSRPGHPWCALTCWSAARIWPRSAIPAMRGSPHIGRSLGGRAGRASPLAPGPRGFPSASQGKANGVGWRSFISLPRGRCSGPLPTVPACSARQPLLCPRLPPAGWSETIPCLSGPLGAPPAGTPRRPPGGSPRAGGAPPLD
jgi:hypothetical protein